MKVSLLFLLLVGINQTSAQSKASLTVSPPYSQYFEYQSVSMSCKSSTSVVWTVWRYTIGPDSILSQCGDKWGQQIFSGCLINTTKRSDSGVYWCESKHRDSSNAVNITVTGGAVILQSPVLPVTEGDDVTLRCKTKNSTDLPAEFSRKGRSIGNERTCQMTIQNVSKSDEDAYSCGISGNKSTTSWLLLKDDSDPAVLTVSPDSSQMFEYRDFELRCGDNSMSHGWKLMRATTSDPKQLPHVDELNCRKPTDSGCILETAKKTDSAIYWCESPTKQRSNSVNITVLGGPVILQIPILPVMKGDNVTLNCKPPDPSKQPAEFQKVDEDSATTGPEGHMTIYGVSPSDEGQYKCRIRAKDGKPVESLPSWLYVIDPDSIAPSSQTTSTKTLTVLRHLGVFCPYAICTVITVSLYRDRKKGKKPPSSIPMSPINTDYEEPDPSYDDVTTEHHF